jgi:WD40 repeat protein
LAEGSLVLNVVFSPDGKTLAAGDDAGNAGLWDTSSDLRITTLAEGSPIDSEAFSPNGRIFAVGDDGGDVGLWDTSSGRRTVTLAEGSNVYGVAFSPDGQALGIGDLNGNVTLLQQSIWNMTGGSLARLVCGEVRENMTQAQWNANAPGQPYQKTCPAYQ